MEQGNDRCINRHIALGSHYFHTTVCNPSLCLHGKLCTNANGFLCSMCQARMSVKLSSVLIWAVLGSLTFGFCSIWSLHFVAMLACELDLAIGINVPLTILSSVLAVFFTFAALASDLLWRRYRQGRRQKRRSRRRRFSSKSTVYEYDSGAWKNGHEPLSRPVEEDVVYSDYEEDVERVGLLQGQSLERTEGHSLQTSPGPDPPSLDAHAAAHSDQAHEFPELSPGASRPSSDFSDSRRSSSFMGSTQSSHALANITNLAHHGTGPAKNAFIAMSEILYAGSTRRNVVKGFLWSLAISGMHYVGIAALRIPEGHATLNPALVVLSGLISWVVCVVGVILMSQIETHFAQQCLFSVVASTGVAAMHFTGMHLLSPNTTQ